jgi:hypothetical protein
MEHGSLSMASLGCTCEACRETWNNYMRQYMRERRRKLRELQTEAAKITGTGGDAESS